jgi:hypothetical protein
MQNEKTHDQTQPEGSMEYGANKACGNNKADGDDYADDRNRVEHPEMHTSGNDWDLKRSGGSQDDESMEKQHEDRGKSGDENSQDRHHGDDDDDDGNPVLGCVCGKIHGGTFKVFWIQCDECDSWFNVARRCVGFTEAQAEQMERWTCRACSTSDDESDDGEEQQEGRSVTNDSDGDNSSIHASPEVVRSKRRRTVSAPKIDPTREVAIGRLVEVLPEGSYRFGGLGKITASYFDEDATDPSLLQYSVKYTIHGYTEHNISAEYVVDRHDELT